jgi:kumamolisin
MAKREPMVAIPRTERVALPKASVVGDANPADELKVTVYVRKQAGAKPTATPDEIGAIPPTKRSYLDPKHVSEDFEADPADLDKVEAFAVKHGLTVLEKSVPKRSVLLEGTVAQMSEAFGVKLKTIDHPTGRYRGRTGPVLIPKSLAAIVQAVFGLDNRRMGRSYLRRQSGPTAFRAAGANSFFPPDVATLYDYPANTDGQGETIGIMTFNGQLGDTGQTALGGYNVADLKRFFDLLNLNTPQITNVVVHGPGNLPGPGVDPSDASVEVLLDIEVSASVAQGATIVMYFTEFTEQGWVDALTTVATDTTNQPSVVSISYGNPEDANGGSLWTAAARDLANEAFERAALHGITFCIASGDDGSSDGINDGLAHVDFPASSPWVLSCGGTAIRSSGATITDERVWNDGQGDAGGGGISNYYPLPDYQAGAKVPPSVNPGHRIGRGVPDVSALAARQYKMIAPETAPHPCWSRGPAQPRRFGPRSSHVSIKLWEPVSDSSTPFSTRRCRSEP